MYVCSYIYIIGQINCILPHVLRYQYYIFTDCILVTGKSYIMELEQKPKYRSQYNIIYN